MIKILIIGICCQSIALGYGPVSSGSSQLPSSGASHVGSCDPSQCGQAHRDAPSEASAGGGAKRPYWWEGANNPFRECTPGSPGCLDGASSPSRQNQGGRLPPSSAPARPVPTSQSGCPPGSPNCRLPQRGGCRPGVPGCEQIAQTFDSDIVIDLVEEEPIQFPSRPSNPQLSLPPNAQNFGGQSGIANAGERNGYETPSRFESNLNVNHSPQQQISGFPNFEQQGQIQPHQSDGSANRYDSFGNNRNPPATNIRETRPINTRPSGTPNNPSPDLVLDFSAPQNPTSINFAQNQHGQKPNRLPQRPSRIPGVGGGNDVGSIGNQAFSPVKPLNTFSQGPLSPSLTSNGRPISQSTGGRIPVPNSYNNQGGNLPQNPSFGRPNLGAAPSNDFGLSSNAGGQANRPVEGLPFKQNEINPQDLRPIQTGVTLNGMPMMMMPAGMNLIGGSCSAGSFCVEANTCNPYTGFIIRDVNMLAAVRINQPQVPLLKCMVLGGGITDGVCCQEAHPIAGSGLD